MQALFDFLSQHVSADLAVFLVSMIPLIELRGQAVPALPGHTEH